MSRPGLRDRQGLSALRGAQTTLDKYPGTPVFVSHDREFVSSLATRIIELKPGEAHATVIDYRGTYEDYLARENGVLAAA